MRRAEAQARLGHAAPGRCTHRERDAEVHHHGAPVIQQEILGLDVAVDHAMAVRVIERLGHLAGDAYRLLHTELRLAVELVADRLPFDVRHHIEEEPVRGAAVEERQDVRMLQARGGLDLHQEALGAEHGGEFGLEDLHRHLAVVLEVLGEVDGGHAARAELALDQVTVGEGGTQTVVHGAPLVKRSRSSRVQPCTTTIRPLSVVIRLNRRSRPFGATSNPVVPLVPV